MKIRKAIIPAAGLGTRMLPATKTIPKEMLPIVDKPSIQYIVEEAVSAGMTDILIVTGRAKTAMDDYFDYHPELESRLEASGKRREAELVRRVADMANIHFVRQKETKGLGHAVWCAKHFVGNEPFAVLLGDDIMRAKRPVIGQLAEAANRYNSSVVGVKQVSDEAIQKYCSLEVHPLEGNCMSVSSMIEKPRKNQILSNYAILGRYILEPEIFDILENIPTGFGGEIQLTDAINILCKRSKVIACDFDGRRYDTGNIEGYLETVLDFALEHPIAGDWMRKFILSKANEFNRDGV